MADKIIIEASYPSYFEARLALYLEDLDAAKKAEAVAKAVRAKAEEWRQDETIGALVTALETGDGYCLAADAIRNSYSVKPA